MLETLFLNLAQHDDVSPEERAAIAATFTHERSFSTGQDIVDAGSRPTHSSLLVEGIAARYKLLADGSRQITALQVSGDFVDLHAFLLKVMDHGIVAMTPCRIAYSDHGALRSITERSPHLARLLWLDTLVDGAVHREWIVAMGRRSKKSHLAHLLCELYVRLKTVNRTSGMSFQLPLSQAAMADVLGLSVVHMNRVIQTLRRERLISWTNQAVTILDWPRLVQMAEFDQTYLSMHKEPR